MKTTSAFLAVVLACSMGGMASAQCPFLDEGTEAACADGWTTGDDGGLGFQSWFLSGWGNHGHFMGNSVDNDGGDPDGDGDIGSPAWAMWANSGGLSEAVRELDRPLAVGQVISIEMDNGYLTDGHSVGVGLRNGNGDNRFELYYVGEHPNDSYKVKDAGGEQELNPYLSFTGGGLILDFKLTDVDTYELTVTRLVDGAVRTHSGTLAYPGTAIEALRCFNYNPGEGGGDKDAYFNSLALEDLVPPTLNDVPEDVTVSCPVDVPPVPVGRALGLYANLGGLSEALRDFDAPLSVGQTFSIDMDNGYVYEGSDSTVGIALQNIASAQHRFELFFKGGQGTYKVTDALGVVDTGLPFTGGGLHMEFTLTSIDTYELRIVRLENGDAATVRGTLTGAAGSQIDRLRVFNVDAGSGAEYDVFVNSMSIYGAAYEDASAMVYNDGWQNGDNAGTGFGPWMLQGYGSHGHFVGSSRSNDALDPELDNDIDTFGITASDNADPHVAISFAESSNGGSGCPGSPLILTRNWEGADDCGNLAVAAQVITVLDESAPTFQGVPPDTSVQCQDDIPEIPSVIAKDDCGTVSLSFSEELTEDGLLRKWMAEDACGNLAVEAQNITVADTTPPGLVCPDEIQLLVGGGGLQPYNFATNPFGDDWESTHSDCAYDENNEEVRSYSRLGVLTYTNVTFTGEDLHLTLKARWYGPPMNPEYFYILADNVTTVAAVMVDQYGNWTDVDMMLPDFHGQLSLSWRLAYNVGYAVLFDDVVLSWGNGDLTNGVSSDTGDPGTPDYDPGCQELLPDLTAQVIVSDNCGGVDVSQAPVPGTVIDKGLTWVSLTALDDSGNVAECEVPVSVRDLLPPWIDCPVEVAVPADINCSAVVPDLVSQSTAGDNCDPVTLVQSPLPGTPIGGGVTEVTLSASDLSGNTRECIVPVSVVDQTPPTLICPESVEITAGWSGCTATLPEFGGGVTDNCAAPENIVVTQSPAAGSSFSLGEVVVHVTATDESGNSSVCDVLVHIVDDIPPAFPPCPTVDPISAGDGCLGVVPDLVSGMPSADNCHAGSSNTLTQDPEAGTLIPVGTTLITITVTDLAGNNGSCVAEVEVIDDTPPTIECPVAPQVSVGDDCEAVLPDLTLEALVYDNCSPVEAVQVTQMPAPGAVLSKGATTVTLTATDEAGNQASCTVVVMAVDNTAPVLVGAVDQTVIPEDCGFYVEFTAPTAADHCDGPVEVTCDPASGSILGPGTHTITCSATDSAGNMASETFTVTVLSPLQVVFLSPLDDDNMADDIETDADAINKFKVGRTIPVKVKIYDCDGIDVTADMASAITVRLDATEREYVGATSQVVNDLPEDYNGVGDPAGTMVFVDGQFHFNLDTDGFASGTLSDSTRFFRIHATVEYNSNPLTVIAEEDVTLESK